MDPAPGAERPGAIDGESVLELFLEMLLSERGAAAHTVDGYRRDIEQFAASQHRRGSDLASADATAVRGYLTELSESGLAPRTAARRLSALRQFYRFMQAEDLRADDPIVYSAKDWVSWLAIGLSGLIYVLARTVESGWLT